MSRKILKYKENKIQDRIQRGKRIKQIRLEIGMTQIDVSREFGVSKGMVSEYENGKYEPPANLILGLSRKSGRNIAWLMTGEEPETDQETTKSSTLRIKDTTVTKLNQHTIKLNEVVEYLKGHPDLLESIWQLIQGKEGLRKFEQGK